MLHTDGKKKRVTNFGCKWSRIFAKPSLIFTLFNDAISTTQICSIQKDVKVIVNIE
jgi:hypothetical protein